MLVNEFEIFGDKYEIIGIIIQPYDGQSNTIIINVKESIFLINKGKKYYYDDKNTTMK